MGWLHQKWVEDNGTEATGKMGENHPLLGFSRPIFPVASEPMAIAAAEAMLNEFKAPGPLPPPSGYVRQDGFCTLRADGFRQNPLALKDMASALKVGVKTLKDVLAQVALQVSKNPWPRSMVADGEEIPSVFDVSVDESRLLNLFPIMNNRAHVTDHALSAKAKVSSTMHHPLDISSKSWPPSHTYT